MLRQLMVDNATAQLLRFVINGVAATCIHFALLTLAMEVLEFSSAGAANLLASIVGIAASFLGNRYFVFRQREGSIWQQALKFVLLYAAIAAVHTVFLFVWTDWGGLDYRLGFVFAMVIQFVLSFAGSRRLVFTR